MLLFCIYIGINLSCFRDPNKPVALPSGIPEWAQYDTVSNNFMELNSNGTKVITTPHKERLEKVIANIFSAKNKQSRADKGKTFIIVL